MPPGKLSLLHGRQVPDYPDIIVELAFEIEVAVV